MTYKIYNTSIPIRDQTPLILTSEMSGVSIKYVGGAACPSTGLPTSFTIKVYCNSTMPYDELSFEPNVTALGQGTLCDPVV